MTRRRRHRPRRSNRHCELCNYDDPQGTRSISQYGERWWLCHKCATVLRTTLREDYTRTH